MKIRIEILMAIFPSATAENCSRYAAPLERAMARFGITTPNRIRAFLAQVGHESGQLRFVEENLNYSIGGLLSVFGKFFKMTEDAGSYARNPEKIANRVYANRMGNGTEASGDGYRFRGRGLIQLTGKNNYHAAGLGLGVDLVSSPEKVATAEYAALTAAWFWQSNGLNTLADGLGGSGDKKAFEAITRKINGGVNGLADRIAIYERCKKQIA